MRIASLVVASQLVGCTLVGGTIGGLSARSENHEHRVRKEPETASAGNRILLGALLGLVIDAIIIDQSLDDCCPDFSAVPK